MPESVRDRPTKAHEYLFLLTKSERYYFDAEAVREGDVGTDHPRNVLDQPEPSGGILPAHKGIRKAAGRNGHGRNIRSVWTIATHPFPEAHFATFPPELPRRCILAGTSERGCCPECGAPWERLVDVEYDNPGNRSTNGPRSKDRRHLDHGSAGYAVRLERRSTFHGWRPTCDHYDDRYRTELPRARRARKRHQRAATGDWWRRARRRPGLDSWSAVPCTVLDHFTGSGTTGKVAVQLGRNFIGIELSPEYAAMAERRIGEADVSSVLERGGKLRPIGGPLFEDTAGERHQKETPKEEASVDP